MFTVYTPTREDMSTIYYLQAELEAQGIHTYLRAVDYPYGSNMPGSLCVLREQDIAPATAIIKEIVTQTQPNWRPSA